VNNWAALADERRYLERLAPDVRALVAIGKPINVAADSRNLRTMPMGTVRRLHARNAPPFRKLNGNSPQ
jgi:hypothetical protein